MTNSIIFDETLYLESWRFNSQDCKLSDNKKSQLIFLNAIQSTLLWKQEISHHYFHLMEIPSDKFNVREKSILDFNDPESGKEFFWRNCPRIKTIIFFWGPQCACIVPLTVLIESWADFFYPSDENSIISLPNFKKKIFSFEETFFSANFR